MKLRHAIAAQAAAAFAIVASPASAKLITVTLTGNSESVHDNADVFGQGIGTLTDLPFVETLIIDTAVGKNSSGGYSSDSGSKANPPFAVSGSLSINGSKPFTVKGSNYSGAHDTVTVDSNPFFTKTTIDYNLITDDSAGLRLDNQLYVDLSGVGLPTSLEQPITLALDPSQVSNVSFTDETSRRALPDAIGNLDPTSLSVSIAAGVPEPATWTMLIAGFGLVGAAMRRRPRGHVARLSRA